MQRGFEKFKLFKVCNQIILKGLKIEVNGRHLSFSNVSEADNVSCLSDFDFLITTAI